ncbi:hypothetical protein U2G91_25925 (plasmid) [Rhodococcoides fascians]|nr:MULTISPECIES: hypothetical protein [Rhodococcus]MBP2527357.1 hypothetical protein [Rhodococcus sp. PvP104]WQH31249.1 hypothetical protein U2G91_25925 [Rhodococcus fascians]
MHQMMDYVNTFAAVRFRGAYTTANWVGDPTTRHDSRRQNRCLTA